MERNIYIHIHICNVVVTEKMYNMFLNHYVLKSCRRATPFLNIGRRTITRTTIIHNNNNNNIYDDLK